MSGELHERGLEPIDADRLLVARLVVHPDVDVVARLQHLLGRLHEAGFVAIDRRDCRNTGQEAGKAEDGESAGRSHVRFRYPRQSACDGLVLEDGHEPRQNMLP